jgi:hypothetical protein
VLFTETERHERERKGDLDKFERVDGDRNLTSVDLAVKKVRVMQNSVFVVCCSLVEHLIHLIASFSGSLSILNMIIPKSSILRSNLW